MIQGNKYTRYFRMALRYGFLWFLYGELPRHAINKRASWARYFFVNENQPTSHRRGGSPVAEIIQSLKRERLQYTLKVMGSGQHRISGVA